MIIGKLYIHNSEFTRWIFNDEDGLVGKPICVFKDDGIILILGRENNWLKILTDDSIVGWILSYQSDSWQLVDGT